MDLNSPLFDRIRAAPKRAEQVEVRSNQPTCGHPGCQQPGQFRAPMGRLREGQYFSFCLDHVREYNATYNYFNGMSDADVARYQKDALIGHRPTWTMGAKRGAGGVNVAGADPMLDPLGLFRARTRQASPEKPRGFGVAAVKALGVMGLEDGAPPEAIRNRYKELVKRLHPDANGGDRSREEKLREIIQAYKYLRSAKLA